MSVQQLGFDVVAPGALTATAGTATGALDATAVYGYKVTYVTGFGETEPGPNGGVTTTATGSANLTAIPVSADGNVSARKIYRTIGGGAAYLLLTTISDNITTTYIDLIADGSLGAAAPTLNTAMSRQHFAGQVKLINPPLSSLENTITATPGGAQAGAYQLSSEINIVTVVATINDSVKLPELSANLIGKRVTVKNVHANAARIYPFEGQQIDALGVNAALAIATTVAIDFVAESATNWRQI